MITKSNMRLWALSLAAAAVAVGCGGSKKKSSNSEAAADEEVDAALTVDTSDGSSLSLLATTATYSGQLLGCKSGRTKSFTEADATVKVLVGDTNCYIRLDTITVSFGDGTSATYIPDTGYAYGGGTSLIATSASSSSLMKIQVNSQLPATIITSPAPSVSMRLSFVDGGSQAATVRAVDAGVAINVDGVVPYQLSSIDLTVDGATGGGAFVFNMNCYSQVAADNKCENMLQTSNSAALAVDTYLSGATPRALTIDECTALATGASKVAPSATYKFSDANALMPNGGSALSIVGPTALCDAGNSKLVYAVANSATSSCKWWRITVTCP